MFTDSVKGEKSSCAQKFTLFKHYDVPESLAVRENIDFPKVRFFGEFFDLKVLSIVSEKRNSYEKLLLTSLFIQIFLVSFMSFTLSYIFHSPIFIEKNPQTGAEIIVSEQDYCLDPSKYLIKT